MNEPPPVRCRHRLSDEEFAKAVDEATTAESLGDLIDLIYLEYLEYLEAEEGLHKR